MLPQDINFEDHRRLLQHTAHRVMRRLHAAGARAVQFEDVFGELEVAWVIARNSWNPERGVPFLPYMMRGAMNHINRWVDKEILQVNIAPYALDCSTSTDEGSFHEVVSDPNAQMPDEVVISQDLRSKILRKVSSKTRQFLEFLDNPPEALVEALRGMQDRADYARRRGLTSVVAPNSITAAMVLDLLGCSRPERNQIYGEIKRIAARISK